MSEENTREKLDEKVLAIVAQGPTHFAKIVEALGMDPGHDNRVVDRSLQRLRKAKKIMLNGSPRRWQIHQ